MTPQITKMLMRCTRRATASTNSMAAMAPANAARISVSEPVSRPRFKKTTIVSATASLAPLEMPMTNGPAIGLAKNVCSRYPATESAAPSSTTMTARGRRSCSRMLAANAFVPRPSRAAAMSAGESAMLPQNRLSANSASRAAAMARYAIVMRLEVCMRGSLCSGRQWFGRIWNPPLRMRHGFVRSFLPPR